MRSSQGLRSGGVALVSTWAAAILIVHILSGARYGFHRDELATLDDARNLAWGYVAYPPVTPFFGWVSLHLFGTSLTGFRFFAACAASGGIVLTGLMARELGGGCATMLLAAFAATPFALACGSLMQYVAFDYLGWLSAAYFFVLLCKSGDPRWWLPLGAVIGIGMLTKYSMLFCVAGIVVGVVATPLRRHVLSKWLWLGAALSIIIFLPNIIWQVHHGFVSLEFLRHIHARDVRIGRTKDFLPDQWTLNLFGLLLAIVVLLLLQRAMPMAGTWMALCSSFCPVPGFARSRLLPRAGVSFTFRRWRGVPGENSQPMAPTFPTLGLRNSGTCLVNWNRRDGRMRFADCTHSFALVELRRRDQRRSARGNWLARAGPDNRGRARQGAAS